MSEPSRFEAAVASVVDDYCRGYAPETAREPLFGATIKPTFDGHSLEQFAPDLVFQSRRKFDVCLAHGAPTDAWQLYEPPGYAIVLPRRQPRLSAPAHRRAVAGLLETCDRATLGATHEAVLVAVARELSRRWEIAVVPEQVIDATDTRFCELLRDILGHDEVASWIRRGWLRPGGDHSGDQTTPGQVASAQTTDRVRAIAPVAEDDVPALWAPELPGVGRCVGGHREGGRLQTTNVASDAATVITTRAGSARPVHELACEQLDLDLRHRGRDNDGTSVTEAARIARDIRVTLNGRRFDQAAVASAGGQYVAVAFDEELVLRVEIRASGPLPDEIGLRTVPPEPRR